MPYTLYSKAFAKTAVDGLKNDFESPPFKVEAKGKSASGVGFLFSGSNKATDGKYEDGKVEITVPVDDKFKVILETNAAATTTVSAELAVTKEATLKLVANNPDFNTANMKVTGELTVLNDKYAVESKFGLWDGPSVAKQLESNKDAKFYTTGTHGIQAGITFDFPYVQGVTLGLCPGFGIDSKGAVGVQVPLSVGYSTKDFGLAFVTGVAKGKDKFELSNAGIKGHFNIRDGLVCGFEADQVFYKLDAKELWSQKSVADKALSQVLKAGFTYAPSKDVTYKAKGTFTKGKGLAIDLSVKSLLSGNNSFLATATLPSGGGAPVVGLTYNLEA